MEELSFDPMDPGFREDPYPAYERMRAESPVFRRPGLPFFAVSRYEDVLQVVRTPEVFSSAPLHMGPGGVPLGRGVSVTRRCVRSV